MDHNAAVDQGEARRAASPIDYYGQGQSVQNFFQKSFVAYDWTQRFQNRQRDLYLPIREQQEEDTFVIRRDTSFDEGEMHEGAPAYPAHVPYLDPRIPSPPLATTQENQRAYVIPDDMCAFLDSYNDPNVPSTSSAPIYPTSDDHMLANCSDASGISQDSKWENGDANDSTHFSHHNRPAPSCIPIEYL